MSKYFECSTNKNPLEYFCGEKIVFSVMARDNKKPIDCPYIQWELMTDDGQKQSGTGCITKEQPLVVEATLSKPGFARIRCKAQQEDGTPDTDFAVFNASAGAEVEKLSYLDTLPEDFTDYWDDVKKMVDDFAINVLYCQESSNNMPDGIKCYDVRIATPEGKPVSGYVCIPTAEGKYPIVTNFIGYGIFGAWKMPEPGKIVACFNAHGIENDLTHEQLQEKYKTELAGYGHDQEENASNKKTYWRQMMIRDLIGLKYIKTLPSWDGKNLTIRGSSQGAFQSTIMASVDTDVSFLDIQLPWFCNLRAEEFGFINGGRPKFAQGLRYFDTVAHAMRVKCPVKMMIGLGDYTCPPSTTLTLYNHFTSSKTLDAVQGLGHSVAIPADAEHFYKSEQP